MVLIPLFRCFWNAILAYLFIYIDIVVSQPEAGVTNGVNTGARIILVVIAIYGTAQMFMKLVLALVHHIAWMTCNCCRGQMEGSRVKFVHDLWKDLDSTYRGVEQEAIDRQPHSRIIKKNQTNKSK